MKKKQILSILLASAMVMSMTACGGSTSSSSSSSDTNSSSSDTKSDDSSSGDKKKITITWRDDGTDIKLSANYQAMQYAYDNWDKKDQVELDFEPITASEGDYFTKIALQLGDVSTCPDLVCEDTFQLPNDVEAGYLTDLSDYVKDWDTWNDGTFYDKMKEVVTTDGKVYGIPYCTDTRGLWYNREILTKAGVIKEGEDWAPKTWDDILDACAKIKDKCPDCRGTGFTASRKKIQVSVPAGIDNGQSIRIREKGEPGTNGGPRGDLLVEVNVARHPIFQRQDMNIFSTAPLTYAQAALGGTVRINTVDGEVEYEVKPGTQTDTRIRLKGKGVPSLRNKNVRGDHYVTFVVQVPTNLNEEAKEALRKFDEACGNRPKSKDSDDFEKPEKKKKSFMDKLKETFED